MRGSYPSLASLFRVFAGSVLSASALTPGNVSGQSESITPQLRWQAGHTYTQETLTETTTELRAIGQAADQKLKAKQTTVVVVSNTPEGGKEARVTFTAVSGELQTQGKTYPFDSANMSAAHPMIRQSVGQSVGSSFVLVYDQNDQFVRVRDASEMVRAPGGNPSLEAIAGASDVADLYRRSLEMGLPKTAVKPGDAWTSEEIVKFPSAGMVKNELRARFDEFIDYRERRHAKISFEGEMKNTGEAASSTVTIGAGSKTFGQVLFDVQRATVSFAAFRAEIFLDVQGKRLPVRQQVTTKLVSVEPPL